MRHAIRLMVMAGALALMLALTPAVRAGVPEIAINEPNENSVWNGTENVVWTARDNEGGLATFTVSFSSNGGATWAEFATIQDNLHDNLTEYEYEFDTATQDDTASARIKVEVVDNENNSATSRSDVFDIMNTLYPPTTTYPADESSIKQTNPTLQWSVPAGPVAVENYRLEISTDEQFNSIVYATTTPLTEITVDRNLADDWYYWRVRATDSRGVVSGWSDASSFEVYAMAPVITSFEIEGNPTYVSSTALTLGLSEANATEVSFSSNGLDWSDWIPSSATVDYSLTGADGQKTVYVRGKDDAGRVSDIEAVEVVLDTQPPTTNANLSGSLGSGGYKGSVAISLRASDSLSGINGVYYRVDNGEWKSGDSLVIAEDGEHKIEYYATDAAGNEEQIRAQSVTVYTPVTPIPYYPILAIVGASIAGIVAGWKLALPRYRGWRRRRFLTSQWMEGLFKLPEDEEGD